MNVVVVRAGELGTDAVAPALPYELRFNSCPAGLLITTFVERDPGTKAPAFALKRAVVVDGVGGGEERPLMLFDAVCEGAG
jgi:hypothetical protein